MSEACCACNEQIKTNYHGGNQYSLAEGEREKMNDLLRNGCDCPCHKVHIDVDFAVYLLSGLVTLAENDQFASRQAGKIYRRKCIAHLEQAIKDQKK